jgi:excinuclease UvrABC nuclease subunit
MTPSGPGVYVFWCKGKRLYVGATRNLARRPARRDRNHSSRYQAIMESDRVELIPCESFIKAEQLEEQLIRKHHPIYNLRMPCGPADLARTWKIVHDNW